MQACDGNGSSRIRVVIPFNKGRNKGTALRSLPRIFEATRHFEDAATHKLVEVSGTVTIEQE